jgi:outer membrane protein OmpA-like peptidoglycan-associated protein
MSMIAIAKPERQTELERLKRILLADERDSIETLRRAMTALDDRVGDDERFQNSMTRGLVAAFRAAEAAQHRELAEALSPLVLAGVRREIVQARDLLVEVLYPITGRLVATAVSRAFQRLVTDINASLASAVRPVNWRRRAKSLLTGRPIAEIILSEAVGFRIERMLLIDRVTGALLATWPAREDETRKDGQAALMGGLLSAIVSFSRDAFEGDGHDLRALDLGDRVVMLRSSARRIVAAVGRGAVDDQLEARADSAFLSFLESSADANDEDASHALLASLGLSLATQPHPARRSRAPVALLIVATLLVAALGYWEIRTFEARRLEQRLNAALAALGERIGTNGGALAFVRDAQARTVRAVGVLPSEDARHELEAAIARELPGYRLEAQVVTATGGPASLDVAMGLDGHVRRLESDIETLRQDTEQRFKATEALVHSEADRLRASIDDVAGGLPDARGFLHLTLSNYAMFFEEGTSYRSPDEAERALDAIATLLKDTPGPRIRLIGHGDDLGPRAANLEIARARAEKVASDLVARGIDHTRLVLAARDGSQEIAGGHGAGSSNRRVIFDLAYVGE